MKKCFLNWNKDTVEDSVIIDHLYELSEGNINLKDSKEDLIASSSLMKSKKRYTGKKGKKGSRHKKRH